MVVQVSAQKVRRPSSRSRLFAPTGGQGLL